MKSCAGTAWSRERANDRLAGPREQPGSIWKSRNDFRGAALRPNRLDLYGIVAGELTIGSPLFGVGGPFLERQGGLMLMKHSIEIHGPNSSAVSGSAMVSQSPTLTKATVSDPTNMGSGAGHYEAAARERPSARRYKARITARHAMLARTIGKGGV